MRFLLIAGLLVLQAHFSQAEQVHNEDHHAEDQHDADKPSKPHDSFLNPVLVQDDYQHLQSRHPVHKKGPSQKKSQTRKTKVLVDKKKHPAVEKPKSSKAADKKKQLHKMLQKVIKPDKMKVQKIKDPVHKNTPAASTSKALVVDPATSDPYNGAWAEVAAWIGEHDGNATRGISGKPTDHAGSRIRGVVSDVDLQEGKFLEIPKKLWLHIGSFPNYNSFNLGKQDACHGIKPFVATRILIAAGIAQEAKKKNKSFYWPYLKNLPTMAEYKAFLPRLADSLGSDSLLDQFDGLPFVNRIKAMQRQDLQTKNCFDAWRSQPKDPSGFHRISWDEFHLALTWLRTRSYGGTEIYKTKWKYQQPDREGAGTLIPGADLMNADSSPNTVWAVTPFRGGSFIVGSPHGGLKSGTELLDIYCHQCDNSVFLATWGVYIEDNEHHAQAPPMGCDKFSKKVSKVVKDTLETSSEHLQELKQKHWTAPRCKSSVMEDTAHQGPLRCSLARLSWETCPQAFHPSSQSKVELRVHVAHAAEADSIVVHPPHPHSLLDDDTFADLIDESSRHDVHRRLHSNTLESIRIPKKSLVRREAPVQSEV